MPVSGDSVTGGGRKKAGRVVFLVVGRLPESLTVCKAEPILRAASTEHVMIFRRTSGCHIPGARYITLPSIFVRMRGSLPAVLIRTLAEFVQLVLYARIYRPSVIHGVNMLPCGWLSLGAAWLSRSRNVVWIIGGVIQITTYHRLKRLWTRLNVWVLSHSAGVTTTGSRVSRYLVGKGVPPEKIFELGGSVDPDHFSPGREHRDIDIVFVGRFIPLKGPDRVLSVVERLIPEFPNLKAYFLGTGEMLESIRSSVHAKGLSDAVILTGHVSDPAPYFKRARLLLMPSESEGLSIAMQEAMACGCVPIVSDVGNTVDAAHHGVTAMVVADYTDTEQFVRWTRELLNNEAKRQSIGSNGRKLVVEKYAVQPQSQIYEHMFQSIRAMRSRNGTRSRAHGHYDGDRENVGEKKEDVMSGGTQW